MQMTSSATKTTRRPKRAKENADAAKRLDELEQASKSDLEKANDRAAKAEAEVGTIPAKVADALRVHLVALHEISKDDAELFLTATDPELLVKQVNGLIGRAGAATEARPAFAASATYQRRRRRQAKPEAQG